MQTIKLKEVGSTGLLISKDGLTVYYEELEEWYDFPTEAPSDYKCGYFYLPYPVQVNGLWIRKVHQAVAMAWEPDSFIGKDKPNVHHCDFNTFNNTIDNLIVLDSSSHWTLHGLIGDDPIRKDEVMPLLNRWESIPWDELFEKYKSGELKSHQEVIEFIKDEYSIEVGQMTITNKFKELNGGLNPSGRKTYEFIALDDPVLIEAFHMYESGELKSHQECADFIKDRTGKEITGRTVGRKFVQLRNSSPETPLVFE